MCDESNSMNTNSKVQANNNFLAISDEILLDTQIDISKADAISIPIAELSTLGAGFSSMLPAFRTVTQTATFETSGLYRVANQAAGDVLKLAKNGNAWGAMKTAEGGSKMAQLAQAGPLTTTTKTDMSINPATLMMAATLLSIEKHLKDIEEMQKYIICFLEDDKEAEIENDVKVLAKILSDYKLNWNNDKFVNSNHQQVIAIKRTAGKNIIFYQKQVRELQGNKALISVSQKVNIAMNKLKKRFRYYQLSLYIYSFASFLEIMLSANFQEEFIMMTKQDIEEHAKKYREIYSGSCHYLEKMSGSAIEANVLKGLGTAGKAMGTVIGNIPLVEQGPVDELLMAGGKLLQKTGQDKQDEVVEQFAKISNPGTGIFVSKLDEVNRIYNHTSEIYFDDEKVYLVG